MVSPHFCAALVALDLGDDVPEDQRRFDYLLTYDRELTLGLAGALLSRLGRDGPLVSAEHAASEAPVSAPIIGDDGAADADGGDVTAWAQAVPIEQLSAFDGVAASIVLADATRPGFPLLYVNPAFERLTGHAAEELISRSCNVLQGAGTSPAARERLAAALRSGRAARETLLNYRADGTPFHNEIALRPLVDGDGRIVQYLGVQTDVTEQVEAVRSLRVERDHQRHALDSRNMGVVVLSPTLSVEMLSVSARDLLGAGEVAALGADGPALLANGDAGALRAELEQALAAEDDDDRTVEATLARDGVSRRIAWRSRRLRDASGTATGLLLSGEDVTALRSAQRAEEPAGHR